MKRILIILILVISLFSISNLKVLAANNESNNVEINYLEGQSDSISCDGCGYENIPGIRYKCAICQNFDYWENA